ncbi:D-alanyl-D-alanine carboxypeptidase family protein [Paeniglutamicibacter sp. R2-26]|uniref:D-alanyl-D-alanine carboxypeptidase family protein n=1 Tax=Paeniglutamicibacter sp. R2-26 TaxID=3144417 RepID=UPI003EE6F6BB
MRDETRIGLLGVVATAASLVLTAGFAGTGPTRAEAAPPVVAADAPVSAPGRTVAESGLRFKAAVDTKLRAKASAKAPVLLRIQKDTVLKSTEEAKSGWYKVSLKGKTGYIAGKHLKLISPKGSGALNSPARYEPGFIVNKDNKLSPSYKPALRSIPRTSKKLTPDAVAAYEKMRKAAKKNGVHLTAISGYRSYARQKALFAQYSRQLGVKQASRISARPGTSEHQTGLAIDIGAASGRCVLSKCFANTREGKWLAKNAHRYGYILRYPKGGERATGYDFEPWHFRYVGSTIAKDMRNKKAKTLEQYYSK